MFILGYSCVKKEDCPIGCEFISIETKLGAILPLQTISDFDYIIGVFDSLGGENGVTKAIQKKIDEIEAGEFYNTSRLFSRLRTDTVYDDGTYVRKYLYNQKGEGK